MYALNPSWNLYATYSSGYKSGGFNVDVLSTVNNIGFDAEHVDNFEVGAKATLFGGRAQANLALFSMDYKDLQVTQYDPITFSNFIGNAASASVTGVELDLVAQPTNNLSVSAGLGVLDATLRSIHQSGRHRPEGQRAAVRAESQRFPCCGVRLVDRFRRGCVRQAGRRVSRPVISRCQNDPRNRLESYTLLNARAGLRLGDGRWTIEAYARNLTDERYAVNRSTELPLLSFLPPFAYDETTTTFGAPRMYGVKLTTRF